MESQMRMVTKEIENELHVVKMPQAHGRACLGDLKMIGMDGKKKIAIFALPVLTITMIGVFQAAKHLLGLKLAWYAGFWIYWPVWCILYPSWMIGWGKMRDLFKHRSLKASGWFLMVFPPLMALVGSFLFNQKEQAAYGVIVYILMSFGNGIFEEVLWRGVYTTLFPDKKLWGVIWPSLWFALWHFAPGSISPLTGVWMLMAGAAVFGTCWGLLAMKTGSIRWSVISHTLSGLFWVIR
jgi:membrane protease YdiL (CAAX protease family)